MPCVHGFSLDGTKFAPRRPWQAYDLILDVLVRPAGSAEEGPPRRSSAATTAATRCRPRTGRNPDAAHDRVSNRTRTPRGRLWWLTTTARSDAAVPSAT